MVIVKVTTFWDVEGNYYVGGTAPHWLVADRLLAVQFPLCSKAWEAFATLKDLGNIKDNIKEACLVEQK